MDKIEQAKMNAMDIFKEVKPTYQKNLDNTFDLDEYTKERLTTFFNRTSEEVLKTSLFKYQTKLVKQEKNNDIGNFNVEVPIITKPEFAKNERLYLLSLYIDKLVEYDFESLGLTSIDIIKKYISYRDIDENKVYDTTDRNSRSDNSYSLKLGFSLIKTCIKENHHNSKMKVYSGMIEE